MIDLKKFCRKSYYVKVLSEPFSDNDYTYATDSMIIIRINKIPETVETETDYIFKSKKLFEENKIDGNEIWIDPPKFEIIEKNCTECNGTGKTIVCKECNGVGSLEFSSDYNYYRLK